MRSPFLRQPTALLGIALFLFSSGFPPFDDATEVDLTLHMLQHVLIILAGVMVSYPLWGRRMLMAPRPTVASPAALLACILTVVFWHLPGPWDAAVVSPWIHVLEHLAFFGVGLLAGSWLMLLSDSAKIGALLAAFFGHMGYAVILISPWNVQVYALYSLADQVTMGWVLLLTGPLLVVGIAYIIARNPDWLGQASGSAKASGRRETFLNRISVPRWVPTVLLLALMVTSVSYFSYTVFAITSQGSPPGGAVVYIQETPLSWQYSPQNITVVLGVNNTVTWISRSISYDTVTWRNAGGAPCGVGLSSCPIAPGQSFTYTFSRAGTYEYYCIYHPWMAGSVTVLSK